LNTCCRACRRSPTRCARARRGGRDDLAAAAYRGAGRARAGGADVYKIKYESTLQAERVAKLRAEVRREQDAIATLRAEWAKLDRPTASRSWRSAI
jgi:hypothetical protein